MPQGSLPGVRLVVERNGAPVQCSSVTYRRQADRVAPAWSISFPHPIPVDPDDEWTIRWGFAGRLFPPLIDREKADGVSQEDGADSYTRSVSGKGEARDLLEYCVPKTLVFINEEWLHEIAPDAGIVDGIVKVVWSAGIGYEAVEERFHHPRLPGKDVADDEFVCITGPKTHHGIARYLANLLGYDFVCNTPDLPLLDTYTVPKGSTWFDAIKKNFLIWFPEIQVRDGAVRIMDIMTDDGSVGAPQRVTIRNCAIISSSESDEGDGRAETVDHVIVKGRATKNTLVYQPYEEPDLRIVEIPEVKLEENEKFVYIDEMGDMARAKRMDAYNGTFGTGDEEFHVYGVEYVKHTEYYHVYHVGLARRKKRKLVREVIETFRSDGRRKHRKTTWFRYGPNKRPIGASTQEEALIRYPGQSSEVWKTVKWHHIFQNRFIKNINRSLTSELIEGLVLCELEENGTVKASPYPMDDMLRTDKSRTAIEKDSDTTQTVIEMDLRYKTTKIDRIDDETLIQRIADYDVLADDVKWTRQIIENPLRDQLVKKSEDVPAVWEYHRGGGVTIGAYGPCFHPPRTIEHEDITTKETADKIAARAFARKGARQRTVTVRLPALIPFETMNAVIRLPDMSYDVDGITVTVPGGDYILKSDEKRFRFTDRGNNVVDVEWEQIITARSAF